MEKNGVSYIEPEVAILDKTGLMSSEVGARVCYDSFDKADNFYVFNYQHGDECVDDIGNSALVEQLSHVYHHESIAEHTVVVFHIKNMGRGVLQELARHRIASYSVRSTRYTMSPLLIMFMYCKVGDSPHLFINYVLDIKLLVIEEPMAGLIAGQIYDRLSAHVDIIGLDAMADLIFSKEQAIYWDNSFQDDDIMDSVAHQLTLKNKRNVGDSFKYIVDDNWATELIMTINLRSMKNFIGLRMSGAAYFQINDLATKMYNLLPEPYRRILKKHK